MGETINGNWPFDANLKKIPDNHTQVTNPAVADLNTAMIDDWNGVIVTTSAAAPGDYVLGSPTDTASGQSFGVGNNNTSTHPITVNGTEIVSGTYLKFQWDGDTWLPAGGSSSENYVSTDLLSDSNRTHTINHNIVQTGSGTKQIESQDGTDRGDMQTNVAAGFSRVGMGNDAGTLGAAVSAVKDGGDYFAEMVSSQGKYRFGTTGVAALPEDKVAQITKKAVVDTTTGQILLEDEIPDNVGILTASPAQPLEPGTYILDSTAAVFAVELENVKGCWKFFNPKKTLTANPVTVTSTTGDTFSDVAGTQNATDFAMNEDGIIVEFCNPDGGVNFYTAIEASVGSASPFISGGNWDANTNTPDLSLAANQVDASGNLYIYNITDSGTQDIGSGATLYEAGGEIKWFAAGAFRYDTPLQVQNFFVEHVFTDVAFDFDAYITANSILDGQQITVSNKSNSFGINITYRGTLEKLDVGRAIGTSATVGGTFNLAPLQSVVLSHDNGVTKATVSDGRDKGYRATTADLTAIPVNILGTGDFAHVGSTLWVYDETGSEAVSLTSLAPDDVITTGRWRTTSMAGVESDLLIGQLFYDTNNTPTPGKLFQGETYNWADNPKLKAKFDAQGHGFITDNGATFTVANHSDFIRAGVTDIGVHVDDTTDSNGLNTDGAGSHGHRLAYGNSNVMHAFDTRTRSIHSGSNNWVPDTDGYTVANITNTVGDHTHTIDSTDTETAPDHRNAYFGIYGDTTSLVVDSNLVARSTDGDIATGTEDGKWVTPKQVKDFVDAELPASSTQLIQADGGFVNGGGTVNMPESFATTNYRVTVTPTSVSAFARVTSTSKTVNSFYVTLYAADGSTTNGAFDWIAVGIKA